jgi:hypothetical protein
MYNPLKYTDPSGHIPEIDDPDIQELVESGKIGHAYHQSEQNEGMDDSHLNLNQDSGSECPEGYENCDLYFDVELSSDEILALINRFTVRYNATYISENFGRVIEALFGFLTISAPYIGIPVVGAAEAVNSTFHDIARDDLSHVVDYLHDAYNFAQNNGGYVHLRAGKVNQKNTFGNEVFLQFNEANPLPVNSPQAWSELIYISWDLENE